MQRMAIGVCTAQRLKILMDRGALQVDNVEYVIVDTTFTDKKKNSIWEQPDARRDLVEIITHPILLARYKSKQARIALF